MIDLDNALKTMKKYGYNSSSFHPYLYFDGKDIGINYSYIDNKYGVIERIYKCNSILDLETFLKKYQWYKLNGKSKNVLMKLNSYEISNPKVIYIRDNHVMMDEEIFNIDIYDKRKKKLEKLSHIKRLIVEIEALRDRYYLKKDEIEKYINSYLKRKEDLRKNYLELQKLVNEYNRKKNNILYVPKNIEYKINDLGVEDVNLKLSGFKNKTIKDKDGYQLLYKVWNLNQSLEMNDEYLNALRNSDDLDEELRLLNIKIDYMNELLEKRHLFKKDLKKDFDKFDSSSTYKSIYSDDFFDKYHKFVERKYDVLDKVNEFRLCEYLNDFTVNREYAIDKNILRCKDELETKKDYFDGDYSKVTSELKKEFSKSLNNSEKNALILYTSIYNSIFNMIINIKDYDTISISKLISLLNITDGYLKEFNKAYNDIKKLLELDINNKVKNLVFADINFSNKESFIESLRESINKLMNIKNKLTLKNNLYLYSSIDNINRIEDIKIFKTSGNISSYMLNKGNDYKILVFSVKKGVNILLSPFYLRINNDKIELMDDKNPNILLNHNDVNLNILESDFVITKFKSNLIKKIDYSYVNKFDISFKVNVCKIRIEKRNLDE